MVWPVGLQCQPLCSINYSTLLATSCFSKPLSLIKFNDVVVAWVPTSSFLNKICVQCLITLFYVINGYLVFIFEPALKFELDNIEGRC
jgi:hypothetical protein